MNYKNLKGDVISRYDYLSLPEKNKSLYYCTKEPCNYQMPVNTGRSYTDEFTNRNVGRFDKFPGDRNPRSNYNRDASLHDNSNDDGDDILDVMVAAVVIDSIMND